MILMGKIIISELHYHRTKYYNNTNYEDAIKFII